MWVFALLIGLLMLVLVGLFAAGWAIVARHTASQWHTIDARQRRRVVTLLVATAIMLAGIANGIAYFTASVAIGGAADKVEGGRYYVRSHGRFTEVSESVWTYSACHPVFPRVRKGDPWAGVCNAVGVRMRTY